MTSSGAPPALERVGPYELLFPIASGGMATVYLARKLGAGGFERDVALKLTHAHLRDDPNWAVELVEEAKLAARVQHPNVVRVHDVEDDPHGVFLVMDYVEGDTLAGLLRAIPHSPLPTEIGVRILDDALSGLHAVHELRDDDGALLGVVHRDFSPQNILVGIDGRARLTDFGVAKAATRLSFTSTGVIKGKTGYMAPEQVRGLTVDRRCDVYAAGVVAWEVFAGKRMLRTDIDPVAALVDAATTEAPRLRDVRPDLPAALDEAIASALALDPARRWPTAAAFREVVLRTCGVTAADATAVAEHVQEVAGERLEKRRLARASVLAERGSRRPPPAPASSLPPPPRRTSWKAYALAFVVASGLGLGTVALVRARRRVDARPTAATTPASTPAAPAASVPEAPSASASAESAPVASATVRIRANAPIARVAFGDAAAVAVTPGREVVVPAPSADARLRAIAVDGREAVASYAAGAPTIAIAFGRAARADRRAPSTSSTPPPAPSATQPLAPSPYE